VVIAAIALVVRWLRFATLPALLILDLSLTIATFLILATLVLIRVLARGEINLHRVQGAMAAYLLLGLAWGSAYELVLVLRPDAFRFAEPHHDPMTLLYYSFVTLTTVGYGDVTPLAPAARSLAIAEALIGQLFPAVLIARLVSMELASKRSRRGA
jgi:voltage-gated potassium channel Kch